MGEEIAIKNGRFSDFLGLVTLTWDWVVLHTVMHHSSTSTYIPNFISQKLFVDGRTFDTQFIRSTEESTYKNCGQLVIQVHQQNERTSINSNDDNNNVTRRYTESTITTELESPTITRWQHWQVWIGYAMQDSHSMW